MPLDAAKYKLLIIAEVGDVDGVVEANIDDHWEMFAGTADLYLRHLLTKRKAIEALQGHVREQVSRTGLNNVSADLSDKMDHLQTMYKNVSAEIATLHAQAAQDAADAAAARDRPMSGQLLTSAPISAPPGFPDMNDPYYRGSPYGRRRR